MYPRVVAYWSLIPRWLATFLHVSSQRCLIPFFWAATFALILLLPSQVGDVLLGLGTYDLQGVDSPHNRAAVTSLTATVLAVWILSLVAWYCARRLTASYGNPHLLSGTRYRGTTADWVRTWVPRLVGLIPFAAWYIAVVRLSNPLGSEILIVVSALPAAVLFPVIHLLIDPGGASRHAKAIVAVGFMLTVAMAWASWYEQGHLLANPYVDQVFLERKILEEMRDAIFVFSGGVIVIGASLWFFKLTDRRVLWGADGLLVFLAVLTLKLRTEHLPNMPSLFLPAVAPLISGYAFVVFVARRRDWLRRLLVLTGKTPNIALPHEFGQTVGWWTKGFFFLSLVGIVWMIAKANFFDVFSIPGSRALGAIGAVAIAIGAVIVASSALQMAIERTPLIPLAAGISLVLPIAVAIFVPHASEQSLPSLSQVPATGDPGPIFSTIDQYLAQWRSDRQLSSDAPIFVVAAAGGGIRAAMHTALTLAYLDDQTNGEFGRHVLVASGVSGGSLGIAAWWEARTRLKQRENTGPENYQYQNAVRSMLAQDYLAPVIVTYALHDLWNPGPPRRGEVLRTSWFEGMQIQGDEPTTLSRPLRNLRTLREGGVAPIIIFNSTRLPVAGPAYFSNFPLGQWQWVDRPGAVRTSSIDVISAVLQSARFPIVSPSGADAAGDEQLARYVDGGYVENSGAEVITQLLSRLNKEDLGHVVPIAIESVPVPFQDYLEPIKSSDRITDSEQDLSTMVDAIFTVRESRASDAQERLFSTTPSKGRFWFHLDYLKSDCNDNSPQSISLSFGSSKEASIVQLNIARSLGAPPLGWVLSDSSVFGIGMIAMAHANCLLKSFPSLLPANRRG